MLQRDDIRRPAKCNGTEQAYDLMYLALAQRLGARVGTADKRLLNALASTDHRDLLVALTDTTGGG